MVERMRGVVMVVVVVVARVGLTSTSRPGGELARLEHQIGQSSHPHIHQTLLH